jgi:hypothetical protein
LLDFCALVAGIAKIPFFIFPGRLRRDAVDGPEPQEKSTDMSVDF